MCLFKQAPSDPLSVLNWLLNDLQKYALGFQHALSPSASSCKHKVGETEGSCQKLPSGNCYSIYADHLNMDYVKNEPQSLRLEMTAAKTPTITRVLLLHQANLLVIREQLTPLMENVLWMISPSMSIDYLLW